MNFANPSTFQIGVLAGVAVIVVLFVITKIFFKKTSNTGLNKKFIREQWNKINDLMIPGKEMNYKLAVIEADKLLDYALKALDFSGDTTADRLNAAAYKHPKMKKVWWAHKVRNYIVHDAGYMIKFGETQRVLSLFKKALKILGGL
ncbi:MAG: hypothetical protein V1928_02755 [Parcubacteria group bacterium]